MTTNTIKNKLAAAPSGLIFVSLTLWGWQTELLLYAIVLGILLELPHFISWRLDLSDKDINQLADLSGILFFLVVIYAFNSHSYQGIYKILELLPFALLLLMLAQNYSNRKGIKTSALFISIRRLGTKASSDLLYEIDISLPYVFICLIAASAGNKHNDLFFIFSTLLIIWALWGFRPKHYHVLQWAMPVILVFCVSYLTQHSLRELQEKAEILFFELFQQYGWISPNPNKTTTAIGSLGRLKLSDRIIMRLKSERQLNTPLYFHETSYSTYEYGTWRTPYVEFDVIEKTPNKNEWQINKQLKEINSFDIAFYSDDTSAIIPSPDNISSLSGKDIIQVETSAYGSTRIEARSGWLSYRLGYTNQKIIERNPEATDLLLPPAYAEDFKKVASELELYTKPAEEVISIVKDYFKTNFYYSITQNQRFTKGRYLSKFLFENKKGHCEYFATATALLLREAGIPTRYTIGFSVQEYSPWQGAYIVRARHAHSWVKYYINGKWQTLDTTPSIWAPMEAEDKTFLEPIMDLLSWARYTITGSDIDDKQENNNWIIWLLIPLSSYLFWRFYKKQRVQHKTKTNIATESGITRFGLDSPVYTLIKTLEGQSDKRLPGETLIAWLKRILPTEKTEEFIVLIKLHYRYRFNPVSDKTQDKQSIIDALQQISLPKTK